MDIIRVAVNSIAFLLVFSTNHIWFGGELLCLQTLNSHPFDRQLGFPVVLNTVILLIKHISGHAKVGHLHCVGLIQPRDRQRKHVVSNVPYSVSADRILDKFHLPIINSHAVTCSQVSVYKLLLGQVLHPFCNLQPKPYQILYSGILNICHQEKKKTNKTKSWNKNTVRF